MTTDRVPGKKWKRRAAWLIAAALLTAAGVAWLSREQTALCPETLTVTSPRLPAAFEGLRVSVVSDVHCAQFGEDNKALLKAVAGQEPDLIAITGDLLDRFHTDYDMVEPLCRGLAAIAPTYFVTGNHEWALGTRAVKGLKQTIAACGVTVLSNEFLPLERDGQTLVLAGIDDPNGFADQKTLPELMDEIRAAYGEAFVLLLAHRNDGELYSGCGVDVTVCGHAHGGLVRLPFTDGLISVERTLFPTWTAGVYELTHGQMMVSRGLGNSGPTFRVFNRPHLPLVVLTQGV